jgi:hypothetical protein
MGVTLLAHASMPLKYWDETFFVATYMINQTPTKVLDYDTPLHKLLGATPDCSNFRVFSCVCWLNLRPYNAHKLLLCSTHCVFLGYNNMHKGFKCLDISSKHIYVSHDVIFNEPIFLFATIHSIAGAQYSFEVLLLPPATNLRDNVFTDFVNIYTMPLLSADDLRVQLQLDPGVGPALSTVTADDAPPSPQ